MTRTSLAFASFALALLPAAAPCAIEGSAVGDSAPEISAPSWFNHIGPDPSLASLRGRTVLIEFWATW